MTETPDENTIFHKIVRREIPAPIIFEDDQVIVINDIKPVAPVHFLVIAKPTVQGIRESKPEHEALIGHMVHVASKIARERGLDEKGYRAVFNAGPVSEVPQLHIHVVGGRDLAWPPG